MQKHRTSVILSLALTLQIGIMGPFLQISSGPWIMLYVSNRQSIAGIRGWQQDECDISSAGQMLVFRAKLIISWEFCVDGEWSSVAKLSRWAQSNLALRTTAPSWALPSNAHQKAASHGFTFPFTPPYDMENYDFQRLYFKIKMDTIFFDLQ